PLGFAPPSSTRASRLGAARALRERVADIPLASRRPQVPALRASALPGRFASVLPTSLGFPPPSSTRAPPPRAAPAPLPPPLSPWLRAALKYPRFAPRRCPGASRACCRHPLGFAPPSSTRASRLGAAGRDLVNRQTPSARSGQEVGHGDFHAGVGQRANTGR